MDKELFSEVVSASRECMKKAQESMDFEEKTGYYKMAKELLEFASKIKSKKSEDRLYWFEKLWEALLAFGPLFIKIAAFFEQSRRMTELETGNVITYSATKGIVGNLRLPPIL
jgi:hypothetical protein